MLSYFLGLRNYHKKRKVRGNNHNLTKKLREVHCKSDSVDRASTLKCQICCRNRTEIRFPTACVCNFLFLSQMITCLEHRLFQTSTTNKLHTHKDSQKNGKNGDGDGGSCDAKTAPSAENKHKLITNAKPGRNNKYN